MALFARPGGAEKIISPERTKIWVEPKQKTEHKVAVIYYLSRNGQLEHPHYIEVAISLPHGLYLRDVMRRLNSLRGQGMANMYFWSAKRSLKNGFVWQDLSENDFIYPCHGNEYILKGTQVIERSSSFRSNETAATTWSALKSSFETSSSSDESTSPSIIRRKKNSWSLVHQSDEYKMNKVLKGIDAATQTNDDTSQGRLSRKEAEELSTKEVEDCTDNDFIQLIRGEDMEEDVRVQTPRKTFRTPSRRIKAPLALRQLIACGSGRFKDRNMSKN